MQTLHLSAKFKLIFVLSHKHFEALKRCIDLQFMSEPAVLKGFFEISVVVGIKKAEMVRALINEIKRND